MEDAKQNLVESSAIPGAKYEDPRKTDLELFYELLPSAMMAAGKGTDARSTNSMALVLVREMLGQCVALGVVRPTIQCLDGAPLAMMPHLAGQGMPGVQGAVAQYPNQPGSGQAAQGTVQQHPTYGGPGAAGANYGRGPVPGQTSNIQPVAMFPTPPQL